MFLITAAWAGGLGVVDDGEPSDSYAVRTFDLCLPSGLRVLFEPRPGRADLSLVMVVDAGRAADPVGQEGMAHLVEHLWFRSHHLGKDGVWEVIESVGGEVNGETRADTVLYQTHGAKRNVRALLQLEGERLTDPLAGVDEAVFAIERDIVHNELRENVLDTGGVGFYALQGLLFPGGHPYGRATTPESLDRITLDDARAFAAAHYRPDQATLLVQGDLDPTTFGRLLEQSLPPALVARPEGDLPVCEQRPVPAAPSPPDGVHRSVEAAVREPVVRFGWVVPADPRQRLLAELAIEYGEGYIEDRLGRGVDCALREVGRAGAMVGCTFRTVDPAGAEDEVRKAIASLGPAWDSSHRDGLGSAYMRLLRRRRAELFLGLDALDVDEAASQQAEWFHTTADANWFGRQIALLRTPDVAQAAQDFGREWFTRQRAASVVTVPGGRAPDTPSDEVHEWQRGPSPDPGEVDLARLAAIVPDPDLTRIERFELPNGLKVVLLPFGELPIARVGLVLPGGSARTDRGMLDAAGWSFVAVPQGPLQETRTALAFSWSWTTMASAPGSVGGRWTAEATDRHWMVGVDGGDAVGQAWLLWWRIVSASDPRLQRRSGWKAVAAAEYRANQSDPESLAWAARVGHLAPDLPLWGFDEGLAADAAATKSAEVEEWIRRVIRPDGATLVAVGRFDPAEMRRAIETAFGGWKVKAPAPMTPAAVTPASPPAARVVVFPTEDTVQSTIAMACPVGATTPNDPATDLAVHWLERELHRTLRSEAGQTYGVGAWWTVDERGPALDLETRVPNAAAAQAVAAVRAGLRAIGEVDEVELARLKLATARHQAIDLQSTEQLFRTLSAEVVWGVDDAWLSGRAARLAAVDLPAFRAALDRCVDHEIVTVVGPASVAAALGPEATTVDWARAVVANGE